MIQVLCSFMHAMVQCGGHLTLKQRKAWWPLALMKLQNIRFNSTTQQFKNNLSWPTLTRTRTWQNIFSRSSHCQEKPVEDTQNTEENKGSQNPAHVGDSPAEATQSQTSHCHGSYQHRCNSSIQVCSLSRWSVMLINRSIVMNHEVQVVKWCDVIRCDVMTLPGSDTETEMSMTVTVTRDYDEIMKHDVKCEMWMKCNLQQ